AETFLPGFAAHGMERQHRQLDSVLTRSRRGADRRRILFDRGNDTVTPPRQCLDKTGFSRRVAEGCAELVSGHLEAAVELDERIGAPEFLPQLLLRNRLSRTLEQCSQHLKGLFLEFHLQSALGQLTRTRSTSKSPKRTICVAGMVFSIMVTSPP